MANKYPYYGDFTIPTAIIDDYHWLADSLIDDTDIGTLCRLIYPPIPSECPNCIVDPVTGRSSSIYKTSGPISFTNHTTCPWCGGEGRRLEPSTEDIRVRVYFNPKDFQMVAGDIQVADGVAQVIGYMSDLAKMSRAEKIILYVDQVDIKQWTCSQVREPVPWGFGNRYFIMFVKRIGA